MATTNISIRMDTDLKTKADALLIYGGISKHEERGCNENANNAISLQPLFMSDSFPQNAGRIAPLYLSLMNVFTASEWSALSSALISGRSSSP